MTYKELKKAENGQFWIEIIGVPWFLSSNFTPFKFFGPILFEKTSNEIFLIDVSKAKKVLAVSVLEKINACKTI